LSDPLHIVYLDSSALVKRYIDEPESAVVQSLLSFNLAATASLTESEVASAMARRFRQGWWPAAERDRAISALTRDLRSLYIVELTPAVSRKSLDLLKRRPLRASDAVQLASCLDLVGRLGLPVLFAAFDQRLREAAEQEGLEIAA